MNKFLLPLFTLITISCSEPVISSNDTEKENSITPDSTSTSTQINEDISTQPQIDDGLIFIELDNPDFDETKQISTLLEQPVSRNQLSANLYEDSAIINRDYVSDVFYLKDDLLDFSDIISDDIIENNGVETRTIIKSCQDGGTITISSIDSISYEMITNNCVIWGSDYFIHLIEITGDKITIDFEFINYRQLLVKGQFVLTDSFISGEYNNFEIFVDIETRGTLFVTGKKLAQKDFSMYGANDTYSLSKSLKASDPITPCIVQNIVIEETINSSNTTIKSSFPECWRYHTELEWDNPGETIVYELTIAPGEFDYGEYYEIAFAVRDAQVKGGNELLLIVADSNNNLQRIGYSPSSLSQSDYLNTHLQHTYDSQYFPNSYPEPEVYYLYLNNFNSNWISNRANSIFVNYDHSFGNRLTFKPLGYISSGNFITPISNNEYSSLNDANYIESIVIPEAGYYFIELDNQNEIFDRYGYITYRTKFDIFQEGTKVETVFDNYSPSGSPSLSSPSYVIGNGRTFGSYYLEQGTYDMHYSFANSAEYFGYIKQEEIDYSIRIDKIEFGTELINYEFSDEILEN